MFYPNLDHQNNNLFLAHPNNWQQVLTVKQTIVFESSQMPSQSCFRASQIKTLDIAGYARTLQYFVLTKWISQHFHQINIIIFFKIPLNRPIVLIALGKVPKSDNLTQHSYSYASANTPRRGPTLRRLDKRGRHNSSSQHQNGASTTGGVDKNKHLFSTLGLALVKIKGRLAKVIVFTQLFSFRARQRSKVKTFCDGRKKSNHPL